MAEKNLFFSGEKIYLVFTLYCGEPSADACVVVSTRWREFFEVSLLLKIKASFWGLNISSKFILAELSKLNLSSLPVPRALQKSA